MNYRIVYSDEIEHGLFNSIKRNHKYIKRERNAAGRWVYTYTDDRKEATKLTEEDRRLARIQFNRAIRTYYTNKQYDDVNENDYSKYRRFQAEIAFQKYKDVVAQYQKQQKYDKVINKIKSVFKIK